MNIYEANKLWCSLAETEANEGLLSEEEQIKKAIIECHCFNRFMDGLEALKQEHQKEINEDESQQGWSHPRSTCCTCAKIAELETVEGI